MPKVMEGYAPLRPYGSRVSHTLQLGSVSSGSQSSTPTHSFNLVHDDTGLFNIPISFRADGLVFFNFPAADGYAGGEVDPYELPDDGNIPESALEPMRLRDKIKSKRFEYMNAFQVFFNSHCDASNEITKPVNPNHYLIMENWQSKSVFSDNGGGIQLPSSTPYRGGVPTANLANACKSFRSLDTAEAPNSLAIYDLYYRASLHKQNQEYATSLILFWSIIERCQNILWDNYIKVGYKSNSAHTSIRGKRKKLLLEDRNYTASIKTQILSLGGVLLDHEIERMDKARKGRNDFMHSLKPVESFDCFIAETAAATLLGKSFGFEPKSIGLNGGGWDYIR